MDGKDLDFAQVIKKAFDVDSGSLKSSVITNLIPSQYDTIQLSYTGSDLTEVVYKYNGTTIATLDLSYSGGNLVEIVRS